MKGYVIIEIYGEQSERFLSICAKRGINIFNIQRTNNNTFTLRMQKCDFFKIRPVAYKTHTRVKILKKT
ncbi:MAG: sporulation protein YqfD, partial [Clostridia bacterium]|nr:sporulation protein YqfD [Clostridia bacterium]